MLDPNRRIVVRGQGVIHCNRYSHTRDDQLDLQRAPEWKTFRNRTIEQRGTKCQNCSATRNLQVHHRYYLPGRRVWEYGLEDLLVLCRLCHLLIHDRQVQALDRAYMDICNEHLRKVESQIWSELKAWMEAQAGDDPVRYYDEDNPADWEEQYALDRGDQLEQLAYARWYESEYHPEDD